eukprot:GHRR01034931.1.p1 GENE.GHRR01034931.1~~GHRR01034931.1.p1  ORF type:complete len:116 (+),score=2.09 GHRR01034931.1:333-680(+)
MSLMTAISVTIFSFHTSRTRSASPFTVLDLSPSTFGMLFQPRDMLNQHPRPGPTNKPAFVRCNQAKHLLGERVWKTHPSAVLLALQSADDSKADINTVRTPCCFWHAQQGLSTCP